MTWYLLSKHLHFSLPIIYLANLLYFLLYMNLKMSLSSSIKNVLEILIRITLNLSVWGELLHWVYPLEISLSWCIYMFFISSDKIFLFFHLVWINYHHLANLGNWAGQLLFQFMDQIYAIGNNSFLKRSQHSSFKLDLVHFQESSWTTFTISLDVFYHLS